MGAAGGVERFEDLHDLPVRLLQGPSVDSARLWSKTSSEAPEGPLVSDRHDRPTTPAEKGDQLSAERELTCPPTGILGCPRSPAAGTSGARSPVRPPSRGRNCLGVGCGGHWKGSWSNTSPSPASPKGSGCRGAPRTTRSSPREDGF